mgnify:CR=1 FL=1
MTKFYSINWINNTLLFIVLIQLSANIQAAGSLDMQIERTIVKALADYNSAMATDDVAKWLKYFEKDATRKDPLLSQMIGLDEIKEYYRKEFSIFAASFEISRVMLKERNAAVEMLWTAIDKKTSKTILLPTVGIFELAPSGKFKSATFYFDSSMGNDEGSRVLLNQLITQ